MIRTLESSIDDILKLRRKTQAKLEDVEDEIKSTEHSRARNFKEVAYAFEVGL